MRELILHKGHEGLFLAPTAAAVVAVLAGALVAENPDIAIALGIAPIILLLLSSPLARLIVISFGGLLTFQSSSEVSLLKSAYLLCFLVSLIGALVSLSRDGSAARGLPTQRVAAAGWVMLSLVGLSFVPALLYGTPLVDWLRDGFSYLLFGAAPLLAIDYARHISRRILTVVFLSCGALATASFFLSWIARRHIGELGARGLGFSSFFLSVALISFAVSKTPWPGSRRFGWSFVAAVALLGLLATATRSSLVVLVAVIVALTLAPTRLGTRVLGAAALASLTIGLGIFALKGGIASNLIDVQKTTTRLATVVSAVAHPGSDQTVAERRRQTHEAMKWFETAPVMGVGPGHTITPASGSGEANGYFVDSPAGFLAKFGLAGLFGLTVFLSLLGRFLKRAKARATPAGLALIAFLATTIVWSVLGTPFDDKGTALALGLLLALTIQETEITSARPSILAPSLTRSSIRGVGWAQTSQSSAITPTRP
jgi:O-antigen ligase/polysaccharide polymerase Wzy-like membrane protein